MVLDVGWLEQRRFAQDLAGFGLTPPQFFVLRAISLGSKHPTMSTVAYDTLQHCATVTGVVDRLVRTGLVARRRDERDRRKVLVELTPSGLDVLAKVRHGQVRRLGETLSRLSPLDSKALLRLLQLYLEALRDQYESSSDDSVQSTSAGTDDVTR